MSRDVKIIVYLFLIYLLTGFTFLVTHGDFIALLPILPILILFSVCYFFFVSDKKELATYFILTNNLGVISVLDIDILGTVYTYVVIISLISFTISGFYLYKVSKVGGSLLLGLLFSSIWLHVLENPLYDFIAWILVFVSAFVFNALYKGNFNPSQLRLIYQMLLTSSLAVLTIISDFIIRIT